MRIRNLKNKEEIINNSNKIVFNGTEYKGKWNTYFNNDNKIHLEIGMGKGKFLNEKARNNLDINFIGLERFDNIVARALLKMDEELKNIVVIKDDALNLLDYFDNDIDKIYLNFSDPWPKDRHEKRRLTSKTFLELYDKVFKSVKDIELRTDNIDFFEYSKESLENYGYEVETNYDFHSNEVKETTEYEDKFVKSGNKIYYLKATK